MKKNQIDLGEVLETFIKNHKELVAKRFLMPYYQSQQNNDQQDPNKFWEEMKWKIESDNKTIDFIVQTQTIDYDNQVIIDDEELDRQRELEDHQNDFLDKIVNAQYLTMKRKWRYLVTWMIRDNGLKPNASWVQDDFLFKNYPNKLQEFLKEQEQSEIFEQYVSKYQAKEKSKMYVIKKIKNQ